MSLREAWTQQLERTPRARTVEVATTLGVSEAELLHSRVGDDAVQLRPEWKALAEALPSLGTVMCLTRNAHVVHEATGPYEKVHVRGPMGGVYGAIIDQRLILSRWATAIAAPVESRRGTLRSLQIFDAAGTAVLKIYARETTDLDAWDALVERFADPSPPASLEVAPLDEPEERADGDVAVEAFRAAWAAMTDTHQAHPLLREHGVARLQAMRLLGPEWVTPVGADTLRRLLERSAADAEPLMVFVGNTGCIQIFSGTVSRIVVMDEWLNVLDPAFNLHARTTGFAHAFVVRKPTDRGLVWSLEIYAEDGTTLCQVFGQRTEDRSQRASWHALLADLETPAGA